MNNLTKSVAALLVAGAATAFGATKEFTATSDVSIRNGKAEGYTDDKFVSADATMIGAVNFCC